MPQIQQLLEFVQSLSIKQKIMTLVVIGTVVLGFILLMTWANRPDYEVLYTNLNQDDAAGIIAKLKEKKILYQLEQNGTVITVPRESVHEMRLTLAGEGLPRGGGVGFEIFDKTSLGTTDFVQKLNYQRAVQGELARTISQFREVEQARVHIAIPRESLFVEEEKKPAASVILKLRGGMTLNNNQVESIVHLVASAVQGLAPEDVTIADVGGRLFYKKSSSDITGSLSTAQLDYQKGIEDGLRKKVEGMLGEVLGPNKAIARVSADIDFQQINITEEKYDPDSAVVRSEQRSEEKSEGGSNIPAGIPGVKGSLAGKLEGSANLGNKSLYQKESEITNYEINKINRQVLGPAGSIKRLSVAVMIDGAYKETAAKEGKSARQYAARTQAEMSQFENIVKKAVGFDEARGDQVEVVNIPFAWGAPEEESPASVPWREYLSKIARPLFNIVLVLIFIFFVAKPLLKWLLTSRPEKTVLTGLPASIRDLEKGALVDFKEAERDQTMQLVQGQPDRAAELVKKWLREK
ncbi:MAG: flagellar basal-body MS-ring/collar protein FliF [Thermodesulfobacteriota bacterium]|nr:flagellar basal-body MS-ring/collar protein FliF [Desulfovibrionales bacterium]MDQ7837244.1 flagellar basal-body MS-ring/collar protein FliF [Thermodesulfobacteriota bacterium]